MKIIHEMAYKKSKVEMLFQQHNEKRINHLILAYLYTDNTAFNHWLNEICAWTSESYRVKPRNKLLSAKTIYDLIWLQPKDGYSETSMTMRIRNFQLDKHLPEVKYNYAMLMEYLESFFIWISNELAQKDNLNKSRIKEVIKGLINAYKIE